jgi:hypothetical protein
MGHPQALLQNTESLYTKLVQQQQIELGTAFLPAPLPDTKPDINDKDSPL